MPQAAQVNQMIKGLGGFIKHIQKLNVLKASNGNSLATFKVTAEDLDPSGDIHGGLATALVDGISSLSSVGLDIWDEPSPSVNIKMTHIKPAKMGDELKLISKLIKVEGNLAFMQVEIFNQDNELLIKGEHTKIRSG